jgi:UMF1 family MFS transporter
MSISSKKRAWLAWCAYDWANSAFATVVLAAVLPVYFLTLVPESGAAFSLAGYGFTLTGPSLWGYAISLSVFFVALSAPYLGAVADSRNWRRPMLIFFCLIGVTGTCLLSLVGPGQWLLAVFLFTLADIGFAGGNIFYNAFLPVLATENEIDRLSARGFAWGYAGGGLALLLVFLMIHSPGFFGLPGKTAATRAGFLVTGLWWLIFALPAFIWVRDKEGFARPSGILRKGFSGFIKTFLEIRPYRDLWRFLLAFLLFNDGIQTIIVVSAVFGREELDMSQAGILGCFLLIQFVAVPGALLFERIAARWSTKVSILLCLLLFTLLTVYAYFMTHAAEFWILGLIVALILGGSQAMSRSLYGSMIPKRKSAEFFGFFAISSKFAAILGPITFATIAGITQSTRLAILALIFFFVIGALLLATVDVERGRKLALKG